METYNDAMAAAASSMFWGDETLVRSLGQVDNPELAVRYMLPACEKKVAVVESMVAEHQAFPIADIPREALAAYDKWTESLSVILARARLQLTCWLDWISNPSSDLSGRIDSLNNAEHESMVAALAELNRLIERAGVSGAPWQSITCAAFNDVRGRIGLPPLAELDFKARQLQGAAGGRGRFFE